jgi:hypothetical protein
MRLALSQVSTFASRHSGCRGRSNVQAPARWHQSPEVPFNLFDCPRWWKATAADTFTHLACLGGYRRLMMRRRIIGCVCLSLMLLTTQAAAQMQPGAPPQRPRPPAAAPGPRPPAPAPAASTYCMFEGKEYSIGAVLCISGHMSQVCSAPDTEHSHSWWSSGPQPLCSAAAFPTESSPITRALPSLPAKPTPESAQPSLPAEPSIPKTAP